MNNRAGQSAIEYLMTYGWMLLVVAIAGGAVFSIVQGQNIENVTGFTSNDIMVEDFGVSNSEGLMFSMNSPVRTAKVNKITLESDRNNSISYIVNREISKKDVISLPGVTSSEEQGEIKAKIMYDSGDLQNLQISGEIQGSLKIEDLRNRTIILDGLKGYWPLSPTYTEGSQALDVSGYNNHGVLNGTEITESNDLENALKFNGNSFVEVEHDRTFENFEEVTMFATAKLDGRTSNWQGLLTKSNHPNSIIVEDDERGFVGSLSIDSDRQYTDTEIHIEEFVGETFSVAHTYDTNTGEALVYIDGDIEADKNKDIGEITWGSADIHIGNRGGGGRPWNGSIKDVMVFDRALSQSEIQTLHNNSVVAP